MKIISKNEFLAQEIPMKKVISQIIQLCENDPIFDRKNRVLEMDKELEELIPKYRKSLEKEAEVKGMADKLKDLIQEINRKNTETKERLIEELGGELWELFFQTHSM